VLDETDVRRTNRNCQEQLKSQPDHIDLRVKDIGSGKKVLWEFCPSLDSFTKARAKIFHTFYSAGGDNPSEFFGFTEDKNHQPNGTRIAFWAHTRKEVDRIAELVQKAGGKTLEGPEVCVDYSPGYYAFFFEDPDGNKLEICCRESPTHCEMNEFRRRVEQ